MIREIKEFTPETLSLEDKEGKILRPEEAEERAEVEKTFRKTALTPGLSPKAKTILLNQAEKAGEDAGQRWRKEHETKLLEEYEARVKEIQEKEQIGDSSIARSMAEAEEPYRLAAATEGIAGKDKDALLKQAELAANHEFLVTASSRMGELGKEVEKAWKEQEEKKDEYSKLCSEIKAPSTSINHRNGLGNYVWKEVIPKWLSEKNMEQESKGKNKETFYNHQQHELEIIKDSGSYLVPDSERAEDARRRMTQLISDWKEILLSFDFEQATKDEESQLNSFQMEQEGYEKKLESLGKPVVFGKKEYESNRKTIEELLKSTKDKVRFHEALIADYKEKIIKRVQELVAIYPRWDKLLTELKAAKSREEEIRENMRGLTRKLKEVLEAKSQSKKK